MYYYMVATCLLGLEGLVADELKFMGAENVAAENGGFSLRAAMIFLSAQILTAALQSAF
jgi:23S rRNA G2445 N2-methylase RlmL